MIIFIVIRVPGTRHLKFNKNIMNVMEDALTNRELTMKEKIEITRGLIKDRTEEILALEVKKAIASGSNKVDIVLKASQCIDSDKNLSEYLGVMGFKEIKISSDFPSYCESYEGITDIKFKI